MVLNRAVRFTSKNLNKMNLGMLSQVQLFATLWIAACQASLSVTNSQGLLKLKSIELVLAFLQHRNQGVSWLPWLQLDLCARKLSVLPVSPE